MEQLVALRETGMRADCDRMNDGTRKGSCDVKICAALTITMNTNCTIPTSPLGIYTFY